MFCSPLFFIFFLSFFFFFSFISPSSSSSSPSSSSTSSFSFSSSALSYPICQKCFENLKKSLNEKDEEEDKNFGGKRQEIEKIINLLNNVNNKLLNFDQRNHDNDNNSIINKNNKKQKRNVINCESTIKPLSTELLSNNFEELDKMVEKVLFSVKTVSKNFDNLNISQKLKDIEEKKKELNREIAKNKEKRKLIRMSTLSTLSSLTTPQPTSVSPPLIKNYFPNQRKPCIWNKLPNTYASKSILKPYFNSLEKCKQACIFDNRCQHGLHFNPIGFYGKRCFFAQTHMVVSSGPIKSDYYYCK